MSTEQQKDEGTIKSQTYELKQQIKRDGNLLVKEYTDDGWSGARLDRPALDSLRADLRNDVFDVVYFHDTDRIARNVVYQNLIVSELLKYQKGIVIKGKDYVQNPENKFTLTVFGAVSELERAKIAERSTRGKREKARQGEVICGTYLLGYTYVPKTDTKPAHLVINEDEAKVVRFFYETYANTETSLSHLIRLAEQQGYRTKKGNRHWSRSSVLRILTNTAYKGVQYYNQTKRIETINEEAIYLKNHKSRVLQRDKKEWIPVKIPSIVSEELFDRVQSKKKKRCTDVRNLKRKYLLSSLLKCGECGNSYSGYMNSSYSRGIKKPYYRCNYQMKRREHIQDIPLRRCKNRHIKAEHIEGAVWKAVETAILQPSVMKKFVGALQKSTKNKFQEEQKNLETIRKKLDQIEYKKNRVLDLYTDGVLSKPAYIKKVEELDKNLIDLENKKTKIERVTTQTHKPEVIEPNVERFCQIAKARLKNLTQEGKRTFLLEVIERITYDYDKVYVKSYSTFATPGGSVLYCPRSDLNVVNSTWNFDIHLRLERKRNCDKQR